MTDDIAALIKAGKHVRTRDRRDVSDLVLDANDMISGTVPMVGPCRWLADGRYADSPGGGAGPLDLILAPEKFGEHSQKGSVVAQLSDAQAKNSCCD